MKCNTKAACVPPEGERGATDDLDGPIGRSVIAARMRKMSAWLYTVKLLQRSIR